MRLTTPLSCIAAFILTGCANTGHLTSALTPASTTDYYEVASPISYVEMRGIGVRWEEGLLPCKFRATQFNSEGTFYDGDGNCVIRKMGNAMMGGPFRGGIWVPKDMQKAKRLFYYFDYDADTAVKGGGVITLLILAANKDEITFMPNIKDSAFLSALDASLRSKP